MLSAVHGNLGDAKTNPTPVVVTPLRNGKQTELIAHQGDYSSKIYFTIDSNGVSEVELKDVRSVFVLEQLLKMKSSAKPKKKISQLIYSSKTWSFILSTLLSTQKTAAPNVLNIYH